MRVSARDFQRAYPCRSSAKRSARGIFQLSGKSICLPRLADPVSLPSDRTYAGSIVPLDDARLAYAAGAQRFACRKATRAKLAPVLPSLLAQGWTSVLQAKLAPRNSPHCDIHHTALRDNCPRCMAPVGIPEGEEIHPVHLCRQCGCNLRSAPVDRLGLPASRLITRSRRWSISMRPSLKRARGKAGAAACWTLSGCGSNCCNFPDERYG